MNSALARSIAGLSNRWRNLFSLSKGSPRPEHVRGSKGAKLACRYLKRNGYKVLYRNFRGHTGGEIDVICRDHDTLVFVEVKTRTWESYGRPLEAMSPSQQKRIARGGLAWLRMLDDPDILFRFDVVEVMLAEDEAPRIEIIKNAFQLPA